MTCYEPTFPLGSIIAAWTTYATFFYTTTWSWRLPTLLQAMFAIIQLVPLIWCPESPRWLVSKGKREKAIAILVKHHANGEANSTLVTFELNEIEAQLEIASLQKSSSWMEWFRTKGNRKRLYLMLVIPFIRQWAGNNLITYYLPLILSTSGITDSKTQLEINGGVNVCAFVFAISTQFVVERWGRRKVLMGSLGMCLVSFTIWTILSALIYESNYTKPSLGVGVIVCVFAFNGFNHNAVPVIETYVQEILTVALRSKGTTMYQFLQQLAQLFGAYVNPIALAAVNWEWYIFYLVALTVWITVIYFFFPETRGLSLEECSLLFDGEEARSKQMQVGEEMEKSKQGGAEIEHAENV